MLGCRATVGWETMSAYLREKHRLELGTRQCRRLFAPVGVSLPQASSGDRGSTFKQARIKNSTLWPNDRSISGPWKRCISSNTGRAAGCGLLRKSRTRCCGITPHARRRLLGAAGRDGKFVFAREQNYFDAATTWVFLRLLHQRSRQRQRRVVVITTTPNTTTPPCIGTGART